MAPATLTLGSQNRWLADGSTTIWNFNFVGGYLATDTVLAYSFLTDEAVRIDHTLEFISAFQVRITPAVAAGRTLVIYRDSSNGGLPRADFTDGGGITESNLDLMAKQSVFVSEEVRDFIGITTEADLASALLTTSNNASAAAISAASANVSEDIATVAAASSQAYAALASTHRTAAEIAAANAAGAVDLLETKLAGTGSGQGSDRVGFISTTNYVRGTLGAVVDIVVHAESFPAIKGDGTTNDTAAIQTAMAYSPFSPFQFGPRTYKVDAGVLLFQGSVLGAGNYETRFTATAGTTGAVIRVKSLSGQWSTHVRDLFIDCQGAGQHGVILEGSYGTAERIKVWHGTGVGFQLGNAAAGSGCFWWTCGAIHTNCLVAGGTGLVIDSSPGGANANVLDSIYCAGLFATGWDIRGIGNRINGTVEWRAGCVDVCKISGINNTIPGSSYFESVAGALPSGKLFNITGDSNTVENLHLQAALDRSLDYYVTDTGLGNQVHVAKSLRYTSRVGQSLKNYFPGYRFDHFPAATQAYGFGAAAGISQDLTTLYLGNPTMKMTLAGTAVNAACVLLTGGSGVTNYPIDVFAGKTISVAVACKTALNGYGGLTYTIVSTALGTQNLTSQCRHSGGGEWEVFADTIKIPTDVTQITVNLKSHPSGTVGTGDVWFGAPSLVFGREAAPTIDAATSINDVLAKPWRAYPTLPTIDGMTTPGVATYSRQLARYKELDPKTLYFEIVLVWTGHTGTGTLQITNGTPFTTANIDAFMSPPLAVYYNNLVVGAGKQLCATVSNNSRNIALWANDPAGGAVASIAMDVAAEIRVSGFCELP